jgi:hypothetical protein
LTAPSWLRMVESALIIMAASFKHLITYDIEGGSRASRLPWAKIPARHAGRDTDECDAVGLGRFRIPPLTREAEKIAAVDRDFRLALLQSTETCRSKSVACSGGKYDPTPSPRRAELPPRYNTARMNRSR